MLNFKITYSYKVAMAKNKLQKIYLKSLTLPNCAKIKFQHNQLITHEEIFIKIYVLYF